jgi:uncharacterized protein YkwD
VSTSIASPSTAHPRWRLLVMAITALVFAAVLLGVVLTSGAQAATYTDEEITFVNMLNDYRAANGLASLLVSDMISEACYRHSHDMAKYGFFDHSSLQSDWFATNATPWDRMAASGYGYRTSMGENIAAGQQTGAEVFAAWKASAGHRANMLNSAYKVIGVSRYLLPGSPYTVYWTTDFGGYVDPTAHAVNADPGPVTTRYQQADSRFVYAGTWSRYSTTSASGGSYTRANKSGSSVTVSFDGTYLAWIATKGTTVSKAYVSLDGGTARLVDLARTATAYQQKVWNTGILTSGVHTVKIWWYPSNLAGKYISVDAFDIAGTVVKPSSTVGGETTRYEQTDPHLIWAGTWYTYKTSSASGGSYARANMSGASVTVNFTGTYLAWIATAGTTLSKAYVSVDDGAAQSVDLARTAAAYQQSVWNTGTLTQGQHTVKIWWDTTNAAGKYFSIDAFEVGGTLN